MKTPTILQGFSKQVVKTVEGACEDFQDALEAIKAKAIKDSEKAMLRADCLEAEAARLLVRANQAGDDGLNFIKVANNAENISKTIQQTRKGPNGKS